MNNSKEVATQVARLRTAIRSAESCINVMDALDRDHNSSSCGDLHDQISTLFDLTQKLNKCADRCEAVNPTMGRSE